MQPLNEILRDYTKEDIVNSIASYLYNISEQEFNTPFVSDQGIKYLVQSYADDVKALKWMKGIN